jgi:diguanylate cyclase (GGDEF)-like protein
MSVEPLEMPRTGFDGALGSGRRASQRVHPPAPLRIALITVLTGVVIAAAGGRGGFWICIPAVLLAASVATSAGAAIWCAAPVVLVSAAVVSANTGVLPQTWEIVVVPLLSVAVMHSVSRRLGHERDVMQLAALSDPLTGLANRSMLMSVAQREIPRHRRADLRFVVLMLDLDGFKRLNDRHGHAAGDEMLCLVADTLNDALRSQDTVARLGGDEFCVIAPETSTPKDLAEKVMTSVSDAAAVYELTTSVGAAVFPDDGASIERLLWTADGRLLAAKRRRLSRAQRNVA